jgi:hypothetical protein
MKLPSIDKVKKSGAVSLFPPCLHGMMMNSLIKPRDDFTFLP